MLFDIGGQAGHRPAARGAGGEKRQRGYRAMGVANSLEKFGNWFSSFVGVALTDRHIGDNV
jgi:hypothetical protein